MTNAVLELVQNNPIAATAIGSGLAGVLVGGGAVAVAGAVASKRKKSSKKKTKKTTTKRKRKTKKKRKGRYTPRTAEKGKDRSTRRIRYTKKGQPYVITRSGKARFIKKSSAKRSHKLKGGRY